MDDPRDATPFLQIIHVSDLHFVHADRSKPSPWPGLRALRRFLPKLDEVIAAGMAGHDEQAEEPFLEFVEEVTVRNEKWAGLPTWIVDTGDLSTFGDDASLNAGAQFLERARTIAGAKLHSMHGNHDAWPDAFPLVAPPFSIGPHRRHLRQVHYPQKWPEPPLTCWIPDASGGEVQLYGLNSVVHDRIRNTLALGEIEEDRYWERGLPIPNPGVQLSELDLHLRLYGSKLPGARDFRILATHHPVHFPPAVRPKTIYPQMFMLNERTVGTHLHAPPAGGSGPKAHLVLSGHTHEHFPKLDTVPHWLRFLAHGPLGRDQGQFVVGSLMQRAPIASGAFPKPERAAPEPNQAEVIRFFTVPEPPHPGLLVTRTLATRLRSSDKEGTSIGPYAPVLTKNGQTYEWVWCSR